MSKAPEELKYTKSHEWVRIAPDGTVTVGITDHAQDLMGDMVFVDLADVGTKVDKGEDCAVVESVKAASDVYAPLSGEVVAVNEALATAPELINKDPYDQGWIFRLKPSDVAELDELLDVQAYQALLAAEKA
jgi:glycine cleavage system H protein